MDNDPAVGLNAAVAAQLRAERGASNTSFDDLAETTGLAKSTLLRYFNSKRAIPVDALDVIAQALGITGYELMRRAEQRQRGNVAPTSDAAGLDELGILTADELGQEDLGLAAQKDPDQKK